MNVLMLGNGFDLNCKLPTKYVDFLNVVEALHNVWLKDSGALADYQTVGNVLEIKKLQEKNQWIGICYETHQSAYNNTAISREVIDLLAQLPEKNLWCKYLINSLNEDIGWIDFEKEIAAVIDVFKEVLPCGSEMIRDPYPCFRLSKYLKDEFYQMVIGEFDFFLTKQGCYKEYKINKAYTIRPYGSSAPILNEETIIKELAEELKKFADALNAYLIYFADKVTTGINSKDSWFTKISPEYAITFNYTGTFEKLCPEANVVHIHGRVNGDIVLGVSPDKDDGYTTADTRFIAFKKYYQRVVFGTDIEYRKLVDQLKTADSDIHLIVMGHSLDATDKDVIQELFSVASEITILYHSTSALGTYIAKIIELYGKDSFDQLRIDKNLSFVSLTGGMESFYERIDLGFFEEAFL